MEVIVMEVKDLGKLAKLTFIEMIKVDNQLPYRSTDCMMRETMSRGSNICSPRGISAGRAL
jgi:hypothetical protein